MDRREAVMRSRVYKEIVTRRWNWWRTLRPICLRVGKGNIAGGKETGSVKGSNRDTPKSKKEIRSSPRDTHPDAKSNRGDQSQQQRSKALVNMQGTQPALTTKAGDQVSRCMSCGGTGRLGVVWHDTGGSELGGGRLPEAVATSSLARPRTARRSDASCASLLAVPAPRGREKKRSRARESGRPNPKPSSNVPPTQCAR